MSQSSSLTHSSSLPSVQVQMPVEKAYAYLRHRPPMAWVSEIISFGSTKEQFSGRCRIDVEPSFLFLDEKGMINGAAAVEFCAQGYGFSRAAYQIHNDIDFAPQRTYLAGVGASETFFENWSMEKDPYLYVDIQTDRVSPPLIIVSGRVLGGRTDQVFADLKLTLYIS